MLTDDQLEITARQLTKIAAWSEQLRAQLEPTPRAGNDGVWHRPTYGPKPPCRHDILDILVDTEQRLRDYAGNLAEDILGHRITGIRVTPREWAESRATITGLADFIRRHITCLGFLEWGPDAAEDIEQMHETVGRFAEPPPPTTPTQLNPAAAATTGTAAALSRALTLAGYDVPPGTIRRWGSEGTIPKHEDETGRPVYRLGDIHTHITKEDGDG